MTDSQIPSFERTCILHPSSPHSMVLSRDNPALSLPTPNGVRAGTLSQQNVSQQWWQHVPQSHTVLLLTPRRKALAKGGRLWSPEAALVPVCCQGLSDMADGRGAPDHRMTTELRLSASACPGAQAWEPIQFQGKPFCQIQEWQQTREQWWQHGHSSGIQNEVPGVGVFFPTITSAAITDT